jgi:glycine oxidase
VAGLSERAGKPIEYARTGTVEVALDAGEVEALRAAGRWLTDAGLEARWLDCAALRELEPQVSAEAGGALYVSRHGFVSVPGLVEALVHSARFAGATLETPAEAVVVSPSSSGAEVRSGDRRWTADVVVVAAGSWSGRLRIDRVARLPIRPVRGQLLHLDWREGPRPGRVIWGQACYAVPWSDGSLLVGATVEEAGFDESATLGGVLELGAAVHRLLPQAAAAAVRAVRVGLRPATPDGLPMIGQVAPGVVAATGHYRNGILLAPLVLDGDRDPALDLTDPGRNPSAA